MGDGAWHPGPISNSCMTKGGGGGRRKVGGGESKKKKRPITKRIIVLCYLTVRSPWEEKNWSYLTVHKNILDGREDEGLASVTTHTFKINKAWGGVREWKETKRETLRLKEQGKTNLMELNL